jgi:hypothetical protein
VVPAGSLVALDVGQHLQGKASVATTVSARSGPVAAAEVYFQRQGGLAVQLGASGTSRSWSFPSSMEVQGSNVSYELFNPASAPANAEIDVKLRAGSSSPIQEVLPAGSIADVALSGNPRIPLDTLLEVTVRSNVGLVVDRVVDSPPGAAAPRFGRVAGIPAASSHWLVDAVPSVAKGASSMVVEDLAARPVEVSIYAAGTRGPVVSKVAAPGSPIVVGPNPAAPIGHEPLLVDASGPVAVELDAAPEGSPGVVAMPVFPLLGRQ